METAPKVTYDTALSIFHRNWSYFKFTASNSGVHSPGSLLERCLIFSDCISFRQRLNSNIAVHLFIYSFIFSTNLFQALTKWQTQCWRYQYKKGKEPASGSETFPSSFLFYVIPWKRRRIFFPLLPFFFPFLASFFPSSFFFSFFLFIHFFCHSTNIRSPQRVRHYPRHWVAYNIKSSPSFLGGFGFRRVHQIHRWPNG